MDTPGLGLLYRTGGGRGAENNTGKHTAMIKRLVKSDCVFVSCQSVCVCVCIGGLIAISSFGKKKKNSTNETILDIKSKKVFLDDRLLKICDNTCAEMRFYGRLNM